MFADADVKVLLGDVNYPLLRWLWWWKKKHLAGCELRGDTIQNNHALLLNPNARTGNLEGNPIHVDMTEAARLGKSRFHS